MDRPTGSLISYFSNRVKREGGVNLAQGTPGFAPPLPLLERLKVLAGKEEGHQYAPGIGNYDLMDLICRYYYRESPITVDHLLILQGATEGIFLTFFYLSTFLSRPFSVLSFEPVYESYPQLAAMMDIPFVYCDYNDDLTIDFNKLEKTIQEQKVKIIMIASPGNPLGKSWSREELVQLDELSRQYEFYIVFDAVYSEIYFNEKPFNPLRLENSRLFYIDSFSKKFSITGWRIGYIITPREHMIKIRRFHDYTGLCAPSILQIAIAGYLANHDFGKEYSAIIREKCRTAYGMMKEVIQSLGFSVYLADGGYFLWSRLPSHLHDGFAFACDLYEGAGLAVVPGENFSTVKKDHIRINIAVESTILSDAASRLQLYLGKPVKNVGSDLSSVIAR